MKKAVITGERQGGVIEAPDPIAREDWAVIKTAISGSLNEMKWVKVPWFLAWGRG